MEISIVVATALNRAIGLNNKLLWHLPADLKFFKEITTGHPVIMGRKTFESVGRPLPNRRNLVISRNPDFKAEGIEVFPNLSDALQACGKETNPKIIGGGEIYKQALPVVNKIYLTLVHTTIAGDTYFPSIDFAKWKEASSVFRPRDEKNSLDMEFKVYEPIV